MTTGSLHSQRGSLILVVMCLLAVLGIALASYLAVSNQSMRLSNRAYAVDVSRHLAEMGLERALRAFSANTFNTWTRSGNQATLTFPITSSHYGSTGIGGTVYLRVDNYRDTTKAIPWSVLTAYAVNDYVWYQGVWYVCKSAPPANEAPSDTTYWTAAPAPWSSIANYRPGNIAILGGNAYRCILAHINTPPPDATYWTAYAASAWSSATTYNADDVVLSGGLAYRSRSTNNLNHAPPDATYWLSAPVIYSEGVAVLPDNAGTTIKTQLRALVAPAALFPNAAGSTTLTRLASSGTVDSYNSVLGTYASQVSTPTNYSAVLAGGNTSGTAVTVTTATVRGYVVAPGASTSPYAPRWTYGAATVTGSAATGIDLTRVSRSPHVPTFDIQTIAAGGGVTLNSLTLPSNATTDLPRGGDTISADGKYYYYTTSQLYLDSGDTLNINSPVVIDVRPTGSTGHFQVLTGGKIVITNNATASLEIHFGGRLLIYSQNATDGGIQNLTQDPKRCILLGTSITNTSNYHYLAVNNVSFTFYGVVYMPNAYLQIYNPSPYIQNIYGALSAKNVYFQHAANLHYDTSLRTAVISGVDQPYAITEWRELTDPAEKITLP